MFVAVTVVVAVVVLVAVFMIRHAASLSAASISVSHDGACRTK